jgi:hypothetical protein
VGEVDEVVEPSGLEVVVLPPGAVVVVEPSGDEVVDVDELDELVALVALVELEELDDVDEVVVATVENVITAVVPELTSLGSSATRIAQSFWLSQENRWLGPRPPNTLKVSEPAPDASDVEMSSVRKSQSLVGFTGFVLHCSIAGLKFGVRPVQETVTCWPSMRPVLGLTVIAPFAPLA